MSPRLQSNPQVAQSNPQVDTKVAQSMLKEPQGCIGAPVLHYVKGGGWELCTQRVIVKRIRDNRCRGGQLVTLPYLTLPYLTLPYLTLP